MPSRLAASLLFMCLWLACPGCGATTVRPPANLTDAVSVIIADYGKHSSLLLPRDEGTWVEWAYGEWRWFAAGETGFWRIPGVMLSNNPGALGRRELGRLEPDPGALSGILGLERAHRIEVERSLARALLAKLDAAFEESSVQSLFNPENGLTFVPDPRPYSMSFHCNTVTAQWLRALGCTVGDAPFVADFRILPPDPSPNATPPGAPQ